MLVQKQTKRARAWSKTNANGLALHALGAAHSSDPMQGRGCSPVWRQMKKEPVIALMDSGEAADWGRANARDLTSTFEREAPKIAHR
ncbi:hypothetical protein GQ54DRAFT_110845 [Martensiomyces pterosporus]|nr:hypothetical protein GQ54DRAFT_110845 [Martensiomyces pterosporus]